VGEGGGMRSEFLKWFKFYVYAISSINAHHTRLVKLISFNLVCVTILGQKFTRQKVAY